MTDQAVAPGCRLRAILGNGTAVVAPGCHDPVSARLVQAQGFPVAYLSGAVASAVELGLPDLGFVGATDMITALRRVRRGLTIPLVVDADTGYGDPVQVAETVRRYEEAGAAGLHIEDQVLPKRCGHVAGKRVVPLGEAVARVRAAADARRDLVVIARTDAVAVEGFAAAVERSVAYAEAGADAVFVEGVTDPDRLRSLRERLGGVPLVTMASEAAGITMPSVDDLATGGVCLVIFPVSSLLAAADATRRVYAQLNSIGTVAGTARMTWSALTDLLEQPAHAALEDSYAVTTTSGPRGRGGEVADG